MGTLNGLYALYALQAAFMIVAASTAGAAMASDGEVAWRVISLICTFFMTIAIVKTHQTADHEGRTYWHIAHTVVGFLSVFSYTLATLRGQYPTVAGSIFIVAMGLSSPLVYLTLLYKTRIPTPGYTPMV